MEVVKHPLKDVTRRSVIAGCALGATLPVLEAVQAATASSPAPAGAMLRTLGAPGRNPAQSNDPQAAAFDELVGVWDVDYTSIDEQGVRIKATGQILAGWVLDGRALQDIWIQESTDRKSPRFMGTTLRFFDPAKGLWRVTFIAPIVNAIATLEGRREGNSITLTNKSPRGLLRWSFHNIEMNRFTWRNELSVDEGKNWRLREDHVMTRRA